MGRSKPLMRTKYVVLGVFGYVLLGALFVAGWLGAYVSPFHLWWLQPLASILPFTTAALCSCALLAFVLFRLYWRILLMLYLPLFFLVFTRFMLPDIEKVFTSGDYGDLAKDDFLKVMTFNVSSDRVIWTFAWRGSRPGNVLSEYHRMYLKAGKWEQPHLTCVQEASEEIKQEWPAALYDTKARLALISGKGLQREEPPMMANNASHLRASAAGPDSFVIRETYQWKGQAIVVFNVQFHSFGRKPWQGSLGRWKSLSNWHLELKNLRQDYLIRARESQQLRLMLEQEESPFIVCGDFNSTPHEWSFIHVARGLQKAPVWRQATYPSSCPLFNIDHILASREWKVVAMNGIDTMISDHLPVIATLVLVESP